MPTFSGIIVPTGTESSGRRTLRDVIDDLARPLNSADSTVRDYAANAFRAAVRILSTKGDWPWEIQDEELALSSNNPFSTVSSTVKKPLAMHYLTTSGGTRNRKIEYCPYTVFVEKYSIDITGTPDTYTIPNFFETGQVRWHPIPSGTLLAMFTYYRVTPPPRVESEAIEIPDYAMETYMSFAWYEFIKRMTPGQRPYPIEVALAERKNAFKELTAMVARPGDTSRETGFYGG